jgi:hypothetical protein
MTKPASRRRFLQDTALVAAGSVLGASSAQTEDLAWHKCKTRRP